MKVWSKSRISLEAALLSVSDILATKPFRLATRILPRMEEFVTPGRSPVAAPAMLLKVLSTPRISLEAAMPHDCAISVGDFLWPEGMTVCGGFRIGM